MLDYKIKNQNNPYVTIRVQDRNNKMINIDYHSYLFGLMGAIQKKKENERHALILVIGDVGNGKSTFVEGLAGLDSLLNNNKLNLNDVAFSMNSFISKMDSRDNVGRIIWGDEFIQAGGNRAMAITSIGQKLKIGLVTKRLKKNTYFLVVDEMTEFAEKIIKMADALIVIKSFGFIRGYFDCYTNKYNLLYLFKAFKEFNKTWISHDVKKIKPDCKGKFGIWRGIFLDPIEFDNLKMEETKQIEESSKNGVVLTTTMLSALKLKRESPNMTYSEIANIVGVHYKTIGDWFKKMKQQGVME